MQIKKAFRGKERYMGAIKPHGQEQGRFMVLLQLPRSPLAVDDIVVLSFLWGKGSPVPELAARGFRGSGKPLVRQWALTSGGTVTGEALLSSRGMEHFATPHGEVALMREPLWQGGYFRQDRCFLQRIIIVID